MPLYETTVVIDSTLEESAITEKLQRFVELLTQAGATEMKQNRKGVRKLAYTIKGKDGQWRVQADYTFIFYEAPGSAVKAIESQLRIDEDVLRYMTVRYDHEPPSYQELDSDAVSDPDEDVEVDAGEERAASVEDSEE